MPVGAEGFPNQWQVLENSWWGSEETAGQIHLWQILHTPYEDDDDGVCICACVFQERETQLSSAGLNRTLKTPQGEVDIVTGTCTAIAF